jgi:hypothetical protein
MGLDRNKPLHLRGPKKYRFDAPDVCKFFLVDFCPYELFMNTKSDVGTCPYKIHDDIIKGEFEREGREFRERYEQKFVLKLGELVGELERKLRRGRERLESKSISEAGFDPQNDQVEEEKIILNGQIKDLLRKVEELGEEGRISEAKTMSLRVEQLKDQLEKLKQTESESSSAFRLERKLEQCETCGAMLVVNDAPLRIQSHYEGRQHNGWDRVRKTLEEWRLKAPHLSRPSNSDRRRDDYHHHCNQQQHGSSDRRHYYENNQDGRAEKRHNADHHRQYRDDDRGRGYGSSDRSSRPSADSHHRHRSRSPPRHHHKSSGHGYRH